MATWTSFLWDTPSLEKPPAEVAGLGVFPGLRDSGLVLPGPGRLTR